MDYGDDASFNRQHNLAGFLAASRDGGHTWQNITTVGAFAGRFAAPMFVACGQNNAPCRAAHAGWLYVFFPGAFDDGSYWCQNDAFYLARVPETALANLSAYEYFAGLRSDVPQVLFWFYFLFYFIYLFWSRWC